MNDDLVLVDRDLDTGLLYEDHFGGYPVPRAVFEEYQRKSEELEAMATALTSGAYTPGWKFRGEPQREAKDDILTVLAKAGFPVFTPLRNAVPHVSKTNQ
jgi:hypothetical protein